MVSLARRAIVLALATIFLSASIALAANGATPTHFTASYDNGAVGGPGGFWTCTGERIVKSAPKGFTKDSETCTITDLTSLPPGTYHLGSGWFSDFDGRPAISGTAIVTANGDGTGTVQLVVYY
jgi:hypothetical protein